MHIDGRQTGGNQNESAGRVPRLHQRSPLHVGISLAGEAGQPFASADCEGIAVSIAGALIGEITGDVGAFSKTSSVAFTVNGGHVQVPTAFEGRPTEVLESTIGGSGPFETSEQTTISVKGEELEITP